MINTFSSPEFLVKAAKIRTPPMINPSAPKMYQVFIQSGKDLRLDPSAQ